MKKLLFVLLPLLFVADAVGQGVPCWYDSLRLKSFESLPQLKQSEKLFYYRLNKWRSNNTIKIDPTPMPDPCEECLVVLPTCFKARFIIPVVVHVVHLSAHSEGTSSNISDNQINDQIENLNRYFANYGNTNSNSVNTGIQFCLAPVGPNNDGIIRTASTLSNHNPNDMNSLMALKPGNLEFSNFLHIFVVNDIVDGAGSPSGIQGYATFPGSDPQGIVIRYKRFGNTTTCTSGCSLDANTHGKVLVHEIGHFLNVLHPFEGGCVGVSAIGCADSGDKCCDVPPVASENSGCSGTPLNSCTNDVPDLDDMIENYMDYTNDVCRTSFTKNQTEIMHYTLLTQRSGLVSPLNINDLNLSCCSFSPRFTAENNVLCDLDSVRFTALNYSNMSPEYVWEIKQGNTIIHSASTNYYKYSWYPPAGFANYQVTLRLIIDSDTATDSIPDMVQVINCGDPLNSSQGTWYFGKGAGLKFRENSVVPDFSASRPLTINTGEGCVSLCDTLGRLLFYGGAKGYGTSDVTPGFNLMELFNNNHIEVTLDKDDVNLQLFSHGSCSQAAVTFPNSADTNQYYLFTNQTADEWNIVNGLSMYIVEKDVSNNIEVIQTNDTFNNVSDEGLIAVPSCEGNWWLLSGTTDRKIVVYEVDGTGKHWHDISGPYALSDQGYLKVSPDGTLLGKNGQLFKFNQSTGQVTHWLDFQDSFFLPYSPGYALSIYGTSFSPNSNVYYYIEDNVSTNGVLWQLDLSKADPITHRQKIVEFPATYFRALQLGPDGKLYISLEGETHLAIIEQPNNVCSPSNSNACGYKEAGPFLQVGGVGGTSEMGLPNMIDAKEPVDIIKEIKIVQQECDSITVNTSVCCATTYEWDFGDLSAKNYTRETGHRYSGNGTYIVSLVIDNTDTITKQVIVGIEQNGINGRQSVCDTVTANSYTADKKLVDTYIYNWDCSNGTVTQLPNTPNTASVRWNGAGSLTLNIFDTKTGCVSSSSINITIRNYITANTITLNQIQSPCKTKIDTVFGSTPSGVGMDFKYGWLYKTPGMYTWSLLTGQDEQNLIPKNTVTSGYKRFIFDNGCYHESNAVEINNVKNTITPITNGGICGGLSKGTDMKGYGHHFYQWEISTDEFASNVSNYPNATSINQVLTGDEDPLWARRRAISSAYQCTTYSNIIRLDDIDLTYEKDLVDKYICHNTNEVIFDFKTGLEKIFTNFSNQLYRKPYGIGGSTPINNHLDASQFDNLDTVYCIQTTGCGDFKSSEVIIYKANSGPSITTHPASQSLGSGTTANLYVVLGSPAWQIKYTWQRSGNNSTWEEIPNEADSILTLSNLDHCQNGRYYRVKVQNGCGVVTSNSALLTVTSLPAVTHDYWMKDHWDDTGLERNPDTADLVRSVDLWIRNSPDGKKPDNLSEEEPLADSSNYIYYTVRNKGTTSALNAKLYLYWTWGGTGEDWPRKWTVNSENMLYNTILKQDFPMGSRINHEPIILPNNIAPGDSIRGYYHWDTLVPQPTWFYPWSPHDTVWHNTANICFLARIQTCDEDPFGMTYRENKDVLYNVAGNNNIVTRNTWMKYLDPPPGTGLTIKPIDGFGGVLDAGTIRIGNTEPSYQTSKICIDMHVDFLNKVNLYVEMSSEIMDIWSDAGFSNTGLTWIEGHIYKVIAENACINSLALPDSFESALRFYYAYQNPDEVFGNEVRHQVSVTQYNNSDFKLGQVWFEFRDNPIIPEPVYYGAIKEDDNTTAEKIVKPEEKQMIDVYPNPTSNNVNVKWKCTGTGPFTITVTDVMGRQVYSTKLHYIPEGKYQCIIPTGNQANGIYNISVSSKEFNSKSKVVLIK